MPTDSTRRCLAVILVCAGVFGTPWRASTAQLVDTPTGRLSLAPCPGASPETALRAAILSVHAYVEKYRAAGPLNEILDHVDPLLPIEAVKIIMRDQSPLRDLHRRRALLRFLTWVPDDPQVKPAIEVLVGSAERVKIIERRIAALTHGDGCPDTDPQVTVNDVVNAALGTVVYGQCDKVERTLATVVEKGGTIGVASQVVAEGSLDSARKGLDPQRFDDCSPLWDEAYLVKVDSSGNVEANANCVPDDQDIGCMPVAGASRPYGETYDTNQPSPARPLFEHFVCDTTPCDVRLLLRIVATRASSTSTTLSTPAPAYFLTYDEPTQWKSFPYPNTDGGTVSVEAEDLSGGGTNKRLTVKGDKTFGFRRWNTTFAIYFMLRRIEMANYLADLVCCPNP